MYVLVQGKFRPALECEE